MAKKKAAKKKAAQKKVAQKKVAQKKVAKKKTAAPRKKTSKKKVAKKSTQELPLEKVARLARTRWYIDYRRWDQVWLNLLKARYGMGIGPDNRGQRESEQTILHLTQAKLPYDLIGSQIEYFYSDHPNFDRFYYYDPEAVTTDVIDAAGIQAIEDELGELCKQHGITITALQELASVPSAGLFAEPSGLRIREIEGYEPPTRVFLPEFPTEEDIQMDLEYKEVEPPGDYGFF
jgi:hypothetical protein